MIRTERLGTTFGPSHADVRLDVLPTDSTSLRRTVTVDPPIGAGVGFSTQLTRRRGAHQRSPVRPGDRGATRRRRPGVRRDTLTPKSRAPDRERVGALRRSWWPAGAWRTLEWTSGGPDPMDNAAPTRRQGSTSRHIRYHRYAAEPLMPSPDASRRRAIPSSPLDGTDGMTSAGARPTMTAGRQRPSRHTRWRTDVAPVLSTSGAGRVVQDGGGVRRLSCFGGLDFGSHRVDLGNRFIAGAQQVQLTAELGQLLGDPAASVSLTSSPTSALRSPAHPRSGRARRCRSPVPCDAASQHAAGQGAGQQRRRREGCEHHANAGALASSSAGPTSGF